jgi:non-heme Fe2+,alpha-ketoglutarate-dependent halogenase
MTKKFGLSAVQIAAYHEHGYIGPFDLVGRDEAMAIGELVRSRRPSLVQRWLRWDASSERHFELPELLALCRRDEALDKIEDLLGPDLLLWRTRIFSKTPGEPPYAFHQDGAFWSMQDTKTSPPTDARHVGVSAWIALHDTDEENGCVEVVPGSHARLLPQVPDSWLFGQRAATESSEVWHGKPMVMRAGQFFLFHNFILHRSGVNRTTRIRSGFSARFTVPGVRIRGTGHRFRARPIAFLLRGEDAFRANPVRRPR